MTKIITGRYFQKQVHYWQQVYEWEDVLKSGLSASLFPNILMSHAPKFLKSNSAFHLFPNSQALVFEMNPEWRQYELFNRSNIIPWIIDFYISSEEKLHTFYHVFDKHKVVLISSIEAFNFLKSKGCPLNIVHLPLSCSDKYKITENTTFNKEFDVLLMGRTNEILLSYLEKYEKYHPNISIVSCKLEDGHRNYYGQDGTFYGNADDRNGMLSLLRKSRIGLFTMRGVIGEPTQVTKTNGFCHVTPRLFELMMTGNHIITNYVDNAEADYYKLPQLFPNTDSYFSFEIQMDTCLHNNVDMRMYSEYLSNHYTSTLIEPLKDIFKTYG